MHLLIQRWHCAGQLHTRYGLYADGMRRCVGSIVIARQGDKKPVGKRHAYRIW